MKYSKIKQQVAKILDQKVLNVNSLLALPENIQRIVYEEAKKLQCTTCKTIVELYETTRPTFFFRGNKKLPIRAGGLLPYLFIHGECYLLMIHKNNLYEDIGGKTMMLDRSIQDTVTREAKEETNGVIDAKKMIQYPNKRVYLHYGKYLLFISELDRDIHLEDFGTKEIGGSPRTFEFVRLNDFTTNLHPRLRDPLVFYYLKEIQRELQELNTDPLENLFSGLKIET